jgi:S2P endopeptidase
MCIFPGAYVDLCTDHLIVISPIRQLRIFCAGVWHNFMLVLIAFALLKSHPIFIDNLFIKKPHVSSVFTESPLKSIIPHHTVIYSVGNCKVNSAFSFYDCLYRIDKNSIESNGYCIQNEHIVRMASFISK